MFAELLTVERSEALQELLASYPFKTYAAGAWLSNNNDNGKRGEETRKDALLDYLVTSIGRAVESGGIARTYCADHRIAGLCVTELDKWASRELGRRAIRVTHLMALGSHEVQRIIKQLMLRETLRSTPRGAILVARVPYTDLTSINALESCGFTATQTSIVLARELEECLPDSTPAGQYEVNIADPEDIDRFADAEFGIPGGFLGWDAGLPHKMATRIHQDWLRTYAREHRLLVAKDNGEPVGLLAECVRTDTKPILGFCVGSIDLLKTAIRYRENGVAAHLLHQSLTAFRRQGARFAELTVDSADAPVVHSCQTQGFLTVGSSITLVKRRI